MTRSTKRRLLLVASLIVLAACAAPPTEDVVALDFVAALPVATADEASGPEAFQRLRGAAAREARERGDDRLARLLEELEPGVRPSSSADPPAARLLRRYVVGRYGPSLVSDLIEMVGFRTHQVEGRQNWDAPEFLRQRAWLAARAESLGLEFASVDGRVDEVTLPGGKRTIGILTHGDVQDVVGQRWSSPPWEAVLVGDRIVGRGTEDDKGPIVTTLYVMAALRDSGWPLGAGLRLMVANGEECCWDEIPYYLERRSTPDVTIGFDASYPVTHAQKAWCEVNLRVAAAESSRDSDGWILQSIQGGSGLSIIAELAEARLRPPRDDPAAVAQLRQRAESWGASHPPGRLVVEPAGDGEIRIVAHGRGGHSSVPESGHNAMGDLTAFLADVVTPAGDWGSLATVVGRTIGTETDGQTLGLAHEDLVMGKLTVNLALFDVEQGSPRARMSLRVPRGVDRARIEARFADVARAFEEQHGRALEVTVSMSSPPHYVSPDGPLVRTLLRVWEEVTGEPGSPVAIGGGTQARLFPDGVDFGPATAMERYRGHGPDEYITVDEMYRNAELTIAALWALSGEGR